MASRASPTVEEGRSPERPATTTTATSASAAALAAAGRPESSSPSTAQPRSWTTALPASTAARMAASDVTWGVKNGPGESEPPPRAGSRVLVVDWFSALVTLLAVVSPFVSV